MTFSPGRRLALTAAQQGIWLGQRLAPESPLYNTAEALEIRGPLDRGRFEAAVRDVLSACEALHQRFERCGDEVLQVSQTPTAAVLELLDADALTTPSVATWIDDDLRQPIDLEREPPFRSVLIAVSPTHHWWILRVHHIVFDGRAFGWVRDRVAQHYRGGAPNPSSRAVTRLADVVADDARYATSASFDAARRFWGERFADQPWSRSWSTVIAPAGPRIHHRTGRLPDATFTALRSVATATRGAWTELAIAAAARTLGCGEGTDDVILGLPMMGALGSPAMRIPCMTMNIVPLRIAARDDDAPEVWLRAVQTELRAVRPHARYRYEQLRRDLRRVGGERRLFGPVVNLMPWAQAPVLPGLECTLHPISAGPVEDLAITLLGGADGSPPVLRLDANADVYADTHIDRIAGALHDALALFATTSTPSAASTITTSTPHSARVAIPDVGASGPRDPLQRILEHARERPHHVALEDGATRLTYAALADRVAALARHFARAGMSPTQPAVLAIPRSADAIVALLATWWLGATYVPVDLQGPRDRTAGILADIQPVFVVTTRAADRPELEGARLFLDDLDLAHDGPSPSPIFGPPSTLAYVLYTSGSTGTPQGVMISRGALAHFIAAATRSYGWRQDDRVLQFAPLHFDASIEEIVLTLALGATLVLRDDAMLESITAFADACAARRVSVLDLPTAFWHELTFALANGVVTLPSSVRTVVIGGEAALPERVATWRAHVRPGVALLNTYGPTETTIVVSRAELHHETERDAAVPIGHALPGVRLVALDRQNRVCPPGETGELWVLGPTLADGYWRRPERTDARFVPLSALPGAPRAYRTGDRARRRPDGAWIYEGRVDDEIKISGHRIDPREVETVLARAPGVRETAVLVVERSGIKALVAFVAPPPDAAAYDHLRSFARANLLPTAVPARILGRDALPKTTSGKVDRHALAASVLEAFDPAPDAGLDPFVQRVLDVWREVLGKRDLGPEDDVFDHGGHSLQTIQVANRLSALTGRPVTVATVFRHPTASTLAGALDPGRDSTASSRIPTDALLRDSTLDPAITPRRTPPTPAVDDTETILLTGALGCVGPHPVDDTETILLTGALGCVGPHPVDDTETILLTGATGFLGPHLVEQLLLRTSARLLCLVRADDDASARRRVLEGLASFGLCGPDLDARLEARAADLSKPYFGGDPSAFAELARRCARIVHNAAAVNLVRPYESVRRTNVEATRQLLEIACTGVPKPIAVVSTIAVAPRLPDAPALEETFFPLHKGLTDGYAQSKWASERLVEQAHQRGLPVMVLRLGRVVGPAASGYVHPADILWRLLRLGLRRGWLPNLALAEPWIPVDDAARIIASVVARGGLSAPVANVVPSPPLPFDRLYAWIRSYGYVFQECPLPSWIARMGTGDTAAERATLAFFERASLEAPAATGLIRARHIAALGLAREFTPIDQALVHRYLGWCESRRWLPAPPGRRHSAHWP